MAARDDNGSQATVETSTDERGAPVVSIRGEIDMSNVTLVEALIAPVINDRPARVVFDCSALAFIDSSGIAALLRVAENTERLELRNPSSTVQRVIQATGLSDILHVVT
jgi:anti-sigma B factor antagonist